MRRGGRRDPAGRSSCWVGPDSPFSRLLSTTWFVAIGPLVLRDLPVAPSPDRHHGEATSTFPDGSAGLVLRLVWILGLSIPLAAATYAWVERPAIRWSQRLAPSPQRDHRGLA